MIDLWGKNIRVPLYPTQQLERADVTPPKLRTNVTVSGEKLRPKSNKCHHRLHCGTALRAIL